MHSSLCSVHHDTNDMLEVKWSWSILPTDRYECLLLFVLSASIFAVVFYGVRYFYTYSSQNLLLSRTKVYILGLSGSGKTTLFTQFVGNSRRCFTADNGMYNVCDETYDNLSTILVDVTGTAERVLELLLCEACAIIFVMDVSTFARKKQEIARALFTTLQMASSKAPVCLVWNKIDIHPIKDFEALEESLATLNDVQLKLSRSSGIKRITDFPLAYNGAKMKFADLTNKFFGWQICATDPDPDTIDNLTQWVWTRKFAQQ